MSHNTRLLEPRSSTHRFRHCCPRPRHTTRLFVREPLPAPLSGESSVRLLSHIHSTFRTAAEWACAADSMSVRPMCVYRIGPRQCQHRQMWRRRPVSHSILVAILGSAVGTSVPVPGKCSQVRVQAAAAVSRTGMSHGTLCAEFGCIVSVGAMLGAARVCSPSARNVASASARQSQLRRDPLAAIGDRDPPSVLPRSPAHELVDLRLTRLRVCIPHSALGCELAPACAKCGPVCACLYMHGRALLLGAMNAALTRCRLLPLAPVVLVHPSW